MSIPQGLPPGPLFFFIPHLTQEISNPQPTLTNLAKWTVADFDLTKVTKAACVWVNEIHVADLHFDEVILTRFERDCIGANRITPFRL